MAEQEEKQEIKFEPKSEVEVIGPCKIRLKVEVAAVKVDTCIESKYEELSNSVVVPGFRKGHVPRPLLDRKFGKSLLDALKVEMMEKSFNEALAEKKIQPLNIPDTNVVESLTVKPGEPFVYSLEVEIKPQIDVNNYSGIKVKKAKIDVTDEDVNNFLNMLAESKAEWVPVPDKTAKNDDQIICDLFLGVDGAPSLADENAALLLTDNIALKNIPLPDFSKSIIGKKVDEESSYVITLPNDIVDKNLAGKKIEIKTKIKAVKRKEVPPMDDNLAKSVGLSNVEELKTESKKTVKNMKEKDARESMITQILDTLIKSNDFAMPEGLVKSSKEDALNHRRISLMNQGLAEEEVQKIIEKEETSAQEVVANYLKQTFILENIATKEKIYATEDDVERKIEEIAARYSKWPHEIKAYLEEKDLLTSLRRKLREEMILEFLIEKAVIEEG